MNEFRQIKDAMQTIGGLSKPSKMPGWGYSLPAHECVTGSKLRALPNSVCSKCYALKGMYVFANVKEALARRSAAMHDPQWVAAMIYVIREKYKNFTRKYGVEPKDPVMDCRYFRVHDSGDLQDLDHLLKWVSVARNVPEVKFWIPTRETGIIRNFINLGHAIPNNMTIRISANRIGEPPQYWLNPVPGLQYSAVEYHAGDVDQCGAYNNNGECGTCRDCWDRNIKTISYKQH